MGKTGNGERIDYLFDTDLKIVQSNDLFPFSLDSVLLARFVRVPVRGGTVADLCTGGGVVPFLLTRRTKARIVGVDIQPEVCRLARRSASLNGLQDRIDLICDDAKELPARLGTESCDAVTCNPPYFNRDSAPDVKLNRHLAIARHEILITLDEVIETASRLLKQNGKFALVHRPDRLVEIVAQMRGANMEPKRLRFVHPKKGREANIVLIEGTKGGRPGLTVLPPVMVYGEDGRYTGDVWSKT